MLVSEVNALPYEEFISVFGNVVEHCALAAAGVWRDRPFTSTDHLNRCFTDFMDQLPIAGKEGILRLHPDLAGRLAQSGGLTRESTKEQASAQLDTMTSEERRMMSEMNAKYKAKFGFPFVICARENKKDAILKGLETRLGNSGETEAITGVNEVKKICNLRLKDIVQEGTLPKL